MDATRVGLTYEDYAALPDDGRRYELHDGVLSVTPAPGIRHQHVIGELFFALHAVVRSSGRSRVFVAPCDVILSNTSVVQPDIVYVADDRRDVISERAIEGAPTLAIEVLSPWTRRIDRQTKLRLYARHGVPYYWIVDPETRTVEAYALRDGGYALAARAAGDETLAAEPFADLPLALAPLWA